MLTETRGTSMTELGRRMDAINPAFVGPHPRKAKHAMYRRTAYGTARVFDDGSAQAHGSKAQTYQWAHKPGAAWPCSTLADHTVTADFDANGDLVDIRGPEDMDGGELTAWASDVIGFLDPSHPAIREAL